MAITSIGELVRVITSNNSKYRNKSVVAPDSGLLCGIALVSKDKVVNCEIGRYGLYEYDKCHSNVNQVDSPEFVNDIDLSVFDELKSKAEKMLEEQFLVYYEFYKRCIKVDDNECETAYIMYNDMLGEYEIHYNKSFVLEKAVVDATLYSTYSIEETMVRSVLFIFMHEMMHALRYHMDNQNSMVKGISKAIINIMGDSFINTELQKSLGMSSLVNCIDYTVTFKGILKLNLSGSKFVKDVALWYKQLTGLVVKTEGLYNHKFVKGEEVSIAVTVYSNGQEVLFGGNSNIYIVELTNFLSTYLETKSAESGSGKGKESSDSSDNSSQGSGDSSSSSSGEEGSSNSSSEVKDRKKADESLDNKDASNKAKSNLEESIASSEGGKSGQSGQNGESSSDLLKSIGADRLVRNFDNVKSWKAKLSKYLKDCLGTTERYNSELANARIEGQYGREEDVNVPKRIVLAFDCSGSMGPSTFKQVMNEVENFLLANKYKRLEIDVIYWGSTAYDVKMKMSNNLVERIVASYKGLGGTSLYTGIQIIMSKYRKFDLCVFFTDGYIESHPDEACRAFIKRVSSRVLWVLTSSSMDSYISKYDLGCKRRIIKAK